MIKRLGIISLPGRGHFYPLTALGKRLSQSGYSVCFFDRLTARTAVGLCGLAFYPIDTLQSEPGPIWPENERLRGPNSLNVLSSHAALVLKNAPKAMADAKIEALLVDQGDLASGSVAQNLGIPFLNVSLFPPVYLSDDAPPFIFRWGPSGSKSDQHRNRRGNLLFEQLVAPILHYVNRRRVIWKQPEFTKLNDVFSRIAIIAQLPRILDFPRGVSTVPILHSGPFCDKDGRKANLNFPWSRLNGKPVVYVSFGTVRTASIDIFEMIGAACSSLNAQLVLTLGGNSLMPSEIKCVPQDGVVVHFAPQIELLKVAKLCITHGGMNTVLESMANGVPLLVIPITDDQPGIAARIEWLGAGVSIRARELSEDRLRALIDYVLHEPKYSDAAKMIQREMETVDGTAQAAQMIRTHLDSLASRVT